MQKTHLTIKDKIKNGFKELSSSLNYKNAMQVPRLLKIIISVGIGSLKDKKKIDLILDRITKIAGQKPAIRGAKKSIASLKTREGDPVGIQVTLRGKRMYGFLEKLINIALPRTKDFKGISTNSIDDIGNITIGIKEHTIFPETSDEDIRDVFGLGITIVSTAKDKKDAMAFFKLVGLPLNNKLTKKG